MKVSFLVFQFRQKGNYVRTERTGYVDQPYSTGYCSVTISTKIGGRMFFKIFISSIGKKNKFVTEPYVVYE